MWKETCVGVNVSRCSARSGKRNGEQGCWGEGGKRGKKMRWKTRIHEILIRKMKAVN